MDRRINFRGNSVLGVFARCTEDFVLLPPEADNELKQTIEKLLDVTGISTSLDGSSIIGCLCCGNSKGFLVSEKANEDELIKIRKYVPIQHLEGIFTALGNNILVNDTAALVNPNMTDSAVEKIGNFFDVDVHKGTIGGLKTVGMAACATNKGILVNPKASKFELERLDEIFGLPVDIGTVNLGSPQVGSGLLANSKGYVVGRETTGHEMGRIEDALGFM
ncbi:MAG TPA: translation initiation factor IF-6 [Candidatus Nanoarchaeia archaeon]|nr:translation initiation factor IF-6 [Candidatus Nanoarchaeia archaeon]